MIYVLWAVVRPSPSWIVFFVESDLYQISVESNKEEAYNFFPTLVHSYLAEVYTYVCLMKYSPVFLNYKEELDSQTFLSLIRQRHKLIFWLLLGLT